MERQPQPKSKSRIVPMRFAVLALACLLVAAAWGANRSAKRSAASVVVRARPAASAAKAKGAAATQAPSATAWRYDAVVKRNLFKPLASGEQTTAGLPALPPMPVDPFQLHDAAPEPAEAGAAAPAPQPAVWVYAGYATVNGDPQAIVEKSDTKLAQFLTVGQTLDGAVVKSISPQAIELTRGGETTQMKLSDAFTATPLNEPPKPTPAPGQNTRGGPGQGGVPGGGGFLQRLMGGDPAAAAQAGQLMMGGGGRRNRSSGRQGGQQ